jgi:hypothetical protein
LSRYGAYAEAKKFLVATRSERLNKFVTDRDPTLGTSVELLCEDHVGTYVLPFLCHWTDGCWRNTETKEAIEARVLGWRESHGTRQ